MSKNFVLVKYVIKSILDELYFTIKLFLTAILPITPYVLKMTDSQQPEKNRIFGVDSIFLSFRPIRPISPFPGQSFLHFMTPFGTLLVPFPANLFYISFHDTFWHITGILMGIFRPFSGQSITLHFTFKPI
jgi:hypothetical protein